MKVADVLASKGATIITIKPGDSIATLSELLRARRIGAAVVSSDGRKIEGVISERDIAYGLGVHKGAMADMPVSALMTRTVITCAPRDEVGTVASTMLSRNIRHIPVEQDGCVVGMVSIRDVLHSRVYDLQQQAAQLRTLVNQNHAVQDRE